MCCCIVLFSQNVVAQNPNSNPNAQAQWKLVGNNADTTKFVGTTNNVDLIFKRNNIEGFRLLDDTATKFLGEVYLDKFKEVPPINSGPPKEVFLKVDNFGKITSTDKSGLLQSIYLQPATCLLTGTGVGIPVWAAKEALTYGILYTGIDCPARVGIGTDNPNSTLTVAGTGFFSSELSVNVLPNTKYQLDIETTLVKQAGIHLFNFHPLQITTNVYGIQNVVMNDNLIAYAVTKFSDNKDVFRVMGDGRVWATDVNVALSINFPDYVFESNYALMPLEELEKYITKYYHLPNIPTEKEVKEHGLSLGEMQAKQLEKIEEITLYLIELKKEIEVLKKENAELKQSPVIPDNSGQAGIKK